MLIKSLTRRRSRRRPAALLLALAAALTPAVLAPHGAAAAPAPDATRAVDYHGLHLDVPASWQVVDLAANPAACVRFDVHAVYLGRASATQQCPARQRGHSEALQLEPLDGTTATATANRPGTAVASAGSAAYVPAKFEVPGEVRFAVPAAGVSVTASLGSAGARTSVEAVLRTAALAPTATAAPALKTAALAAAISAPQPGTYTGRGFDPCAAPSSGAMNAWLNSPYRAIGVYIGGVERACAQANLTSGWVSTVTGAGWHLFPLYVGSQAPCNSASFGYTVSYDPATAYNQGVNEADDAANNAQALGLPGNSTIYNDMEAYNNGNASCSTGVLNYISGWTSELHARGYLSGEYSSAGSGIADLVHAVGGSYALPDQIDFAWWNGAWDTNGGSYVPAGDWANHQRIHQYSGGVDETYGGVTINIDGDYLDIASGGAPPPPPPPPSTYWVDTFANAPVYSSPWSATQTGTVNQGTNYVYCKTWGPAVGNAAGYNHWWLLTDPDSGPSRQYVSAYYLSRWGNDQALDNNGNAIADCVPPPLPGRMWVDTFANAPVFSTPWTTGQTGTLNAGTNYVYCKQWGRMIGNSTSFNHWWLLTDPDSGPTLQYVSAYYLSKWGNDQALDDNGNTIPTC